MEASSSESESLSFNAEEIVTLIVGSEQQKIVAHGSYLTRDSEYFKAALKKEWVEGQTRTIELPEACPETVTHYLQFIYGRELSTSHVEEWSEQNTSSKLYPLLAELYVLAEKVLNTALRNALITEFMRLPKIESSSGYYYYPSMRAVDTIYAGTVEGSLARRWLVDVYATRGEEEWMEAGYNSQFLNDLAGALFRATMSEKTTPGFRFRRLEPRNYKV